MHDSKLQQGKMAALKTLNGRERLLDRRKKIHESIRQAAEHFLKNETPFHLGDLLTDTMRRDILRAFGYEAHLEEFISLEHTMKNVLLKAERHSGTFDIGLYDKVLATADLWGARPKLLERTAVR